MEKYTTSSGRNQQLGQSLTIRRYIKRNYVCYDSRPAYFSFLFCLFFFLSYRQSAVILMMRFRSSGASVPCFACDLFSLCFRIFIVYYNNYPMIAIRRQLARHEKSLFLQPTVSLSKKGTNFTRLDIFLERPFCLWTGKEFFSFEKHQLVRFTTKRDYLSGAYLNPFITNISFLVGPKTV